MSKGWKVVRRKGLTGKGVPTAWSHNDKQGRLNGFVEIEHGEWCGWKNRPETRHKSKTFVEIKRQGYKTKEHKFNTIKKGRKFASEFMRKHPNG